MLLAELEVFHSRPIAPTRRVSLGVTVLPSSPAPGFGGLLVAGIASRFASELDPEYLDNLIALTHELEAGHRIGQPRLRHRLQDDRVGLNRCRHVLWGTGEELIYDLDSHGAAEPTVLAAAYAAGRLAPDVRPAVLGTLRRALRWRGDLGTDFIEYLTESGDTAAWSRLGGTDPLVWALGVLGLAPEGAKRVVVQNRFRELLRDAHPDHGGASGDAAERISELTEARRILLNG